ncbi:hypothetical protein ACIBFB_08420 [Nocardiopsis sp. NPDC050513]|uniref:hypothetical protein n=1 Tax=Nocardiopsis sp. NPDC050513 TaxID=3364338 RepID=UPI003792EFA5
MVGDLCLRIGFDDDVDERQAVRETRGLLRVLERLDADRVEFTRAEDAEGTRAGDPVTLMGAVTVAGLAGRFVVKEAVTLITAWLETRADRTVTLEVGDVRLTAQGPVSAEEVRSMAEALASALPDATAGPGGGDAVLDGTGEER